MREDSFFDQIGGWIFWGVVIAFFAFRYYADYAAEQVVNKHYTNSFSKIDKVLAFYPFNEDQSVKTLCGRFVIEDKVTGSKSNKILFITFDKVPKVSELNYFQAQNCVQFGENETWLYIDGALLGLEIFLQNN